MFHKIKSVSKFEGDSDSSKVIDTIHVQPEQTDIHGQIIPVQFDMVLVCGKHDTMHGKDGNPMIFQV